MNSQQFKSWFEGFTEQMSGPPNELQWKRIKEKVTSLQPAYYPGGYPYYWWGTTGGQIGVSGPICATSTTATTTTIGSAALGHIGGISSLDNSFEKGRTDFNNG